jgi:hypothetical protein
MYRGVDTSLNDSRIAGHYDATRQESETQLSGSRRYSSMSCSVIGAVVPGDGYPLN